MGKIARLLLDKSAAKNWQDRELAKVFVATKLGTKDGATFLADLFPLPAKEIDDWPFIGLPWKTKDEFQEDQLEPRHCEVSYTAKVELPIDIYLVTIGLSLKACSVVDDHCRRPVRPCLRLPHPWLRPNTQQGID